MFKTITSICLLAALAGCYHAPITHHSTNHQVHNYNIVVAGDEIVNSTLECLYTPNKEDAIPDIPVDKIKELSGNNAAIQEALVRYIKELKLFITNERKSNNTNYSEYVRRCTSAVKR